MSDYLSRRVWVAWRASFFGTLFITALYGGCGSDFFGSSPKPRPKAPSTLSPSEKESPRLPSPEKKDPTSGGVGSGSPVGTSVKDNAIQLIIVQTPSESWWKNCLLARTQLSKDWTPVACNKDGNASGKTVDLPGLEMQCNVVQIRVETYRNLQGSCSPGRPCAGPYPMTPDADRSPFGEPENFRIYGADSAGNPDRLIRSNANWPLPDFGQLAQDMDLFRGPDKKNQWLRVFFEDQSAEKIAGVQEGRLSAQETGIDFNDYVFDVKGEKIRFTLQGLNSETTSSSEGCD